MKPIALSIVFVFAFAMRWQLNFKTVVMLCAAIAITVLIFKSK